MLRWVGMIGVLMLVSWGCDTSHVDSINQMNKGIKAYQGGKASEAKQLLRQAIDTDPKNHKAFYQLGMIHSSANDFENAIKNFGRAAELRSEFGDYHYYLGKSHQEWAMEYLRAKNSAEALRHLNEAKEAFIKAAEVDQYHADAYYRLGQVREELGEISEAIDAYEFAIKSNAKLREAYLQLGLLYMNFSFYEQAAAVLLLGVRNLDTDAGLRSQLGIVYQHQNRLEEAIAEYAKAFELNEKQGGDRAEILPAVFGMGMANAELKKYGEAKKWLNKFLELSGAGGKAVATQVGAARGKLSEIKRIEEDQE